MVSDFIDRSGTACNELISTGSDIEEVIMFNICGIKHNFTSSDTFILREKLVTQFLRYLFSKRIYTVSQHDIVAVFNTCYVTTYQ